MPHDLEALVRATGWRNPSRRLTLLAEPLDLTRLGRDLDADREAQRAGRKPLGLWYATGSGWVEKVYCDRLGIGQWLYAGVEVDVAPRDCDINNDRPPPWSWLRGWDVTSGCLWDRSALRAVRLLRGPDGIVTVRTRTRR